MKPLQHYIILLAFLPLFISVGSAADTHSVGVVLSVDNTLNRSTYNAFSETLEVLGYGPDKLRVFVQKPHADLFSWANSARRADAAGVDALVTIGLPMTRVALLETAGLPIIFASVFTPLDIPIEGQRVLSDKDLQQAFGIYNEVPIATLLKAYADIKGPSTVTAVFLANDPDATYQIFQLQQAASFYNIRINSSMLDPAHFSKSVQGLEASSDAFFISSALFDNAQLEKLLSHIETLRRPVLGLGTGLASRGALVSLENDSHEQGAVAAQKLVQVLKGEEVFHAVNHKPRKVDLVLNLLAAKTVNLQVPFNLLSSATRIIR